MRPIERALEERADDEAEAIRGYCLAVRSALTDDGRPPLDADGLKLKERLQDISDHVRRCRNQQCMWYHRPYRPEEEGRWALPHGEFGLDVIALVGTLRYISHRSVTEIHKALCDRGVRIANL